VRCGNKTGAACDAQAAKRHIGRSVTGLERFVRLSSTATKLLIFFGHNNA